MCRIINYLLDHKYATVRWRREIIDINDYSVEIHMTKFDKIGVRPDPASSTSNVDLINAINFKLKCALLQP